MHNRRGDGVRESDRQGEVGERGRGERWESLIEVGSKGEMRYRGREGEERLVEEVSEGEGEEGGRERVHALVEVVAK